LKPSAVSYPYAPTARISGMTEATGSNSKAIYPHDPALSSHTVYVPIACENTIRRPLPALHLPSNLYNFYSGNNFSIETHLYNRQRIKRIRFFLPQPKLWQINETQYAARHIITYMIKSYDIRMSLGMDIALCLRCVKGEQIQYIPRPRHQRRGRRRL